MQVKIFQDKAQLGHEMAKRGADLIKAAVAQDGQANIILATGASQDFNRFCIPRQNILRVITWAK